MKKVTKPCSVCQSRYVHLKLSSVASDYFFNPSLLLCRKSPQNLRNPKWQNRNERLSFQSPLRQFFSTCLLQNSSLLHYADSILPSYICQNRANVRYRTTSCYSSSTQSGKSSTGRSGGRFHNTPTNISPRRQRLMIVCFSFSFFLFFLEQKITFDLLEESAGQDQYEVNPHCLTLPFPQNSHH